MHCSERLRTQERASPGLTARTVVYNKPFKSIRITPRKLQHTHSQCLLSEWSPPLRKTRRAHVCCAARTSTCSRWGSAITRCVTAAPPRCGCCASRSTAPSAGNSSTRCRRLSSSSELRPRPLDAPYTRKHDLTTPITRASVSIYNGSGCVRRVEMTWKS